LLAKLRVEDAVTAPAEASPDLCVLAAEVSITDIIGAGIAVIAIERRASLTRSADARITRRASVPIVARVAVRRDIACGVRFVRPDVAADSLRSAHGPLVGRLASGAAAARRGRVASVYSRTSREERVRQRLTIVLPQGAELCVERPDYVGGVCTETPL